MQDRILNALNAILILICVGCVWYLATAHYVEPVEIAQAPAVVKPAGAKPAGAKPTTKPNRKKPGAPVSETSLQAQPDVPVSIPKTGPMDPKLTKNPFFPLYTPTPTPTPTPAPTPPPADLDTAVYSWQVRELGENKVTFEDTRTPGETFELTVGGPGRKAMDSAQRSLEVKLLSVDLGSLKATVGSGDRKKEISY
jgi:hypothetical protein